MAKRYKRGQIVEVRWDDAPNSRMMVVHVHGGTLEVLPCAQRGDVDEINKTQVVRVVRTLREFA